MEINNNDQNRNRINEIILTELIRGIFTVIPFIFSFILYKSRNEITTNEKTVDELKADFSTGHNWTKEKK